MPIERNLFNGFNSKQKSIFTAMKTKSTLFLFLFSIIVVISCKSKQPAVGEESTPPPNSDSEMVKEEVVEVDDSALKEEKKRKEKTDFLAVLNKINGVTAKIIEDQNNEFHSMYELQVEQPVDHFDSRSEKFTQKVYLSHKDINKPMVMYLDGYNVGSNAYVTEAAGILEANQIHVEHRFFDQSRPEVIPWDLLTIKQSAYDHHRIVELLKSVYREPWVSTGISKGGMVTIFHKRFFPDDVAVAMPYVAPINLERHDPRIYEHLKTVGSEACRNTVLDFQKALLLSYDESVELFKLYAKKAGYKFPHGYESSFELSVFEFSFAFWQNAGDCNIIPSEESTLEEKMQFLFFQLGVPSFFNERTMTEILPFFYQGYYEIGMYGYEVDDFKGLTREFTEEVDNQLIFIPEDLKVEYNPEPIKDIVSWLDENGNNMIYIYGEYDPWGATAYQPTEKTNSLFLELGAGNHGTRLRAFPRNTQAQAMDSLKVWVARNKK